MIASPAGTAYDEAAEFEARVPGAARAAND
jgi:hypothetical protein